MSQNELFIINDIEMAINPSDIQVMEDNWVIDQSFLRSKSVYCFRSQYAATKVVLQFPFEITHLTSDNAKSLNNTYNCIRLAVELSEYPYCFIKNERIRNYISPSSESDTGFLIFAVEEIGFVQDQSVSNMVFLEVVLQYFDHSCLIQDFMFRSSLSIDDVDVGPVPTLQNSTVWKKYINPKIEKVFSKLTKYGLLDMVSSGQESIHPMLRVDILVPQMFEISNDTSVENYDDGRLVSPDVKVITVTDTSKVDNGSYESNLMKLAEQDFSFDTLEKTEASAALNATGNELVLKDVKEPEKKDSISESKEKSQSNSESGSVVRPFLDEKATPETLERVFSENQASEAINELRSSATSVGSKDILIDWRSENLQDLQMGVQKIEIRRKNRLASHPIASVKHPIIQYMGRLPTKVNLTLASVNFDIYAKGEDSNTNTFIKQVINVLDYNRIGFPEAEGYNFLKIRSLATCLFDTESFLPGQSVVVASANNQGLESIAYSFSEGDLSSFIEDGVVEGSGKQSVDKADKTASHVFTLYLYDLTHYLQDIIKGTTNLNAVVSQHILDTFKLFIELGLEIALELGFSDFSNYKALQWASRAKNNLTIGKDPSLRVLEIKVKDLERVFDKNKTYYEDAKVLLVEREDVYKYPDTVQVSTLQMYLDLIHVYIKLISIRATIVSGKGSDVPNINFKPSGNHDRLVSAIVSKINTGLNHEVPVLTQNIKIRDSDRDIISKYSTDIARTFTGYNLKDLDYEILVDGYKKETDVRVQKIDPFFFIIEFKHMEDDSLLDTFNTIEGQGIEENSLEVLNKTSKSTISSVDSAGTLSEANYPVVGLTYRKLQEINYEGPKQNVSGIIDAISEAFSGVTIPTSLKEIADFFKADPERSNKKSLAQKVDPKYVEGIEKALKKYGLENNDDYRNLIYSFMLIESGNGGDMTSGTGAAGIFQFTSIATREVLQNANTVEFSNGAKLPSSVGKATTAQALSYIPQFKSDHYFSAQMFIEFVKILTNNNSYRPLVTDRTGKINSIQLYALYNLGPTAGRSVALALKNNNPSMVDKTGLDAIVGQRIYSGSNPQEAYERYMRYVADTLVIDNVPPSVKGEKKPDPDATTLEERQQNSTAQNARVELQNKNAPSYKAAIAGVTYKGTLQNVLDGDTFDFKLKDANITYRIRLAGVNTVEKDSPDPKVQEFSKKATSDLMTLLSGKEISVTPTTAVLDPFGRLIASVTLPDNTSASLSQLNKGNGFFLSSTSNVADYQKAAEAARKNKVGLWSAAPGVIIQGSTKAASDFKEPIKEVAVKRNVRPIVASEMMRAVVRHTKKDVRVKRLHNVTPYVDNKFYTHTRELQDSPLDKHDGIDSGAPEGTLVVALAGGKVKHRFDSDGYGRYLDIDHGNGLSSRYAHVLKHLVPDGAIVYARDPIAISGGKTGGDGAGKSVAVHGHLHFEVSYGSTRLNPYLIHPLTEYTGENPGGRNGEGGAYSAVGNAQGGNYYDATTGGYSFSSREDLTDILPTMVANRAGVTAENTVYNDTRLGQAIVKNMVKDINKGMSYALPAIRVYMTVGNENDNFLLDSLKGGIQYYELKGIGSFHMNCNNDSNPIDTAVMTLANPSFLNTDAFMGMRKLQGVNVNAIGTDFETQFKNNRIQVKPGLKLHVRLGYGNDPNELKIVFNGSVIDVEEIGQSLRITCESFSKELLSEILHPNEPKFLKNQGDNITTSMVLGECLSTKGIEHFGYNSGFWADKFKGASDPEDRQLASGVFSFSYSWWISIANNSRFRSRAFANIFAPEIEHLEDEYSKYKGWISYIMTIGSNHATGYPFAVFKMTPWACMKQMEYRHPNTICKPIMYEDRMSLFYGIKEQFCFKRDLNREYLLLAESGEGNLDTENYFTEDRVKRLEPAFNIHMVSSSMNLISNGTKISSDYKTVINVMYTEDEDASDTTTKPWDLKHFKATADDNLYPWEFREKDLSLSGCIGRYSAFLYGTTELKKEAEKMYSGRIFMLGNSSVKAGDYIYLDDSVKRMSGLMLVRECYHHFDDTHGFVTEIVPGQYVEAANFLYSSLWLKLMCVSKIGATQLQKISANNFNSKDFNMVYDYLTVMHQAELALEDFEKKTMVDNIGLYAINGAMSGLSLVILNKMAKIIGIGSSGAPLRKLGINLGSGILNTPKEIYTVFRLGWHKKAFDLSKEGTKILYEKGKTATIARIGNSKFFEKAILAREKFRGTKLGSAVKLLYGAGRLVLKSAAILGRVILGTMLGVLLANPLGLLVDAIATYVIMWAFAKIEENNLTRQPLLYFPVIKSGKPYVGGMAGVIRNSWWDSKQSEFSKTYKELQKSANILAASAEARGSRESLYARALKSVAGDSPSSKYRPAQYVTDSVGQAVTAKEPKTPAPINVGMSEEQKAQLLEENNKRKLIEETNRVVVESASKKGE